MVQVDGFVGKRPRVRSSLPRDQAARRGQLTMFIQLRITAPVEADRRP
jgi:hypothetical protein